MREVRVSVRRMVEFILRSGSIDAAYMSANRALEGTRVHQQIQKQRKKDAKTSGAVYTSEIPLNISREYRGVFFHVEGRADGIWRDENGLVTVDEIKSTLRPVSQIESDSSGIHWAQAKMYGYMYAQSEGASARDGLNISLIYCHVETGEKRVFTEYFSNGALEEFFLNLLALYWDFANMDLDRAAERNKTAKALKFPYGAYRQGQRELAVAVFAAIKQKRKLFAQAPTGIGKTISTVYPAVKALAEGHGEKIFYLTAKTIARQVAEDAFSHMTAKGLTMRVITLTARDKLCFLEKRACNPETCRFADGHFDRVNAAILDCVGNELIIARATVEAYAKKHEICPGEYQLDLALFCDAVICDYNHAYDPKAKIQRFFQFGGDFILLNDESHNLIDRARDMFSAGLYKNDFTSARAELGRSHPLYKSVGLIAKEIRAILKGRPGAQNNEHVLTNEEKTKPVNAEPPTAANNHVYKNEPFCLNEQPAQLLPLLIRFAEECDIFLSAVKDGPPYLENLLSLYFGVLDYLRVSQNCDERYAFYCEPAAGFIRLYCLDPSFMLAQEQKKSRACVFFSATLTPLPYFRALLGGDTDDFYLRLASPFPRENLCLLIDNRISTRYKDRAGSYEAVAERLFAMISGKAGNYFAFFPSYAYLTAVSDIFTEKYPHIRARIQVQDMSEDERGEFLADFTERPAETQIVFAVLGGVFSEGVDLTGERLIGAAIIGVGIPQISVERDVIMAYHNRFDDTGFAFAYRYPGMNKVLQAAGRVIRTGTDRGVVLLIDSRFTEAAYRCLFPPEWDGYGTVRGGGQLADIVKGFWEGN